MRTGATAPCVICDNGRFYMYYSSLSLDDTDDHLHFLKVAIADRPEGPFAYAKTLFDKFSIGAHVVSDAAGHILFYSVNDYMGNDSSRPGTVILEDRMRDLLTPSGKPEARRMAHTRRRDIRARSLRRRSRLAYHRGRILSSRAGRRISFL